MTDTDIKNSSSAETDVAVEEEVKIEEPKMWSVIFHNDDKTTMDFVIALLMEIFHKSLDEATEIMFQVHSNGKGVAGIFTYEIAEEKRNQCISVARAAGFPLNVSIEEND